MNIWSLNLSVLKWNNVTGRQYYMRTACKSSLNKLFCNTQSIHNVSLCNKSLIVHFSIVTLRLSVYFLIWLLQTKISHSVYLKGFTRINYYGETHLWFMVNNWLWTSSVLPCSTLWIQFHGFCYSVFTYWSIS